MRKENVFIVYFSPAGSTRHVAKVVEKRFQALDAEVSVFDLTECHDNISVTISRRMENAEGKSCLFIGSPVYASHAVPPVMECIAGIKENSGLFAVPFVTWGGACSGVSLHEMGKDLVNKKATLLGAAKILSVHSLMWTLEDPLGKGHPDAGDDHMIEALANHVHRQLHEVSPEGINLSALAYQTKADHEEMEKTGLQTAKAHLPERKIDTGLCNQCRVCSEVCPTDAVRFTPFPEFGDGCVFCFNCMRKCPEEAIIADLSGIWQRIRDRAAYFSERPYSQIFLP